MTLSSWRTHAGQGAHDNYATCQGSLALSSLLHSPHGRPCVHAYPRPFWCPQLASKVQKASVTKEEVERYLEYDLRHGAKYVEANNDADMDEDDW